MVQASAMSGIGVEIERSMVTKRPQGRDTYPEAVVDSSKHWKFRDLLSGMLSTGEPTVPPITAPRPPRP